METITADEAIEELIFLGHISCVFEDSQIPDVMVFFCAACNRRQRVSYETFNTILAGQDWLLGQFAIEHLMEVVEHAAAVAGT